MCELIKIGEKAKKASYKLANLSSVIKNNGLKKIAELLLTNEVRILEANEIDIKNAKLKGISDALLDRLTLNKKRIEDMSKGVLQIISLCDPIGEVLSMW